MNLMEMQNQITDLGAQIRAAAADLRTAALRDDVAMDEVERRRETLDALQQRMNALQAAYDVEQGAARRELQPVQPVQQPKSLRDMLASNEYARAFAFALRNGLNRKNGRGREELNVLFDALTESGNSGADGGFLVPEDIDRTIIEQRRQLDPLAALFNEETVTAPTGWRVTDTSPTKGLVAVNEMGSIDDDDDQPLFAKVTYQCAKKALILPVSNELMTDNVANLFAYIGRWFAKKLVITENILLVTALRTLTAASINSDPLAGLTTALNKGLDPAISAAASIILNQTALDVLDQLKDNNERPLLTPDPTNAMILRFKGRPIHAVSNATMADVTGSPDTSDIFVGDGHAFATLFRCGGYELASTDVGGNAWRTDSTEIRGIARLGVSKFDADAMVRRTVNVPA